MYMSYHGVCPSWEHLWNLGHPGWLCRQLVKWLGTKVATPCPKHQLACSLEKGRGQLRLKPNILVFLEVPITEALCTDSQGRL